jgi:predicted HAD superfamily Cof-like phosphohydrolase
VRTQHQQRVDEFMRLAKQELPDRPTLPDEKTRKLRAKLILEEALETVVELGFDVFAHDKIVEKGLGCLQLKPNKKENLEGIADGCADILVVTTGTFSACGLDDNPIQIEVDINNLAKFEHRCPKCGEFLQPDDKSEETGLALDEYRCQECGNVFVSGYHNEYGKWVKPPTHKPPRIEEIIDEQCRASNETTVIKRN